jgi:hypothetical protein
VKEIRSYSYILDLPDTYRGTNLSPAERLRKAADDLLPQQYQEPPAAEEINGKIKWEVEEVLALQLHGRSKVLQYQVR